MQQLQTKTCSKCGDDKPLSEFHKHSSGKFGVNSVCKVCRIEYNKLLSKVNTLKKREQSKQYYIKNKDKIAEYHKIYYQNNNEKCAKRQKQYRELNSDSIAESNKQYYESNRDKILYKHKEYYQANREKVLDKHKEYRTANSKNLNELKKHYRKQQYQTNSKFRMSVILRSRLYNALKSQNAIKQQSAVDLIGCSIEFLIAYLVSKFTEGMNLERLFNGEIHIDHIRPCASFDLTDPEQQKQCFHFTNLQPLWAEDNLKKSDKYIA